MVNWAAFRYLGSYSGASLLHSIVTKAIYNEVLDRTRQKFTVSKVDELSMARESNPVATCFLCFLPRYLMQTETV